MKQSKGKGTPKIPNSVPKRDHYQRITYLYQLGTLAQFDVLKRKSKQYKVQELLSRQYINQMMLVSKKAVLKLHPNVKRTVCKACSRLLVPGITSNVEIINNSKKDLEHANTLSVRCQCGKSRIYPYGKDPDYELYIEREGKSFDLPKQ